MNRQPLINVSKPLMFAIFLMLPLMFAMLACMVVAAIIALTGGHIVLGLLCLPFVEIERKQAGTSQDDEAATATSTTKKRKILGRVVLVARAALAILASQWLVLGLAVVFPLAMIGYGRLIARSGKRIASEAHLGRVIETATSQAP